jgi:hypothetical protein
MLFPLLRSWWLLSIATLHKFFIRLSKLRNNPINLALDISRWLVKAHAQFSRSKSQQSSKLKPQV